MPLQVGFLRPHSASLPPWWAELDQPQQLPPANLPASTDCQRAGCPAAAGAGRDVSLRPLPGAGHLHQSPDHRRAVQSRHPHGRGARRQL